MTDVSNQFELTRENLQNKGITRGYRSLSIAIANLIRTQGDALDIFEHIISEAEFLAGLVTNSSEGFENPSGLMSDADYKAMQQAIDQNFESWQFIHKALLKWESTYLEKSKVRQHFDRASRVLRGYSISLQDECEDDCIPLEIVSMINTTHELQEMLKGLQIFYENCLYSKVQKDRKI